MVEQKFSKLQVVGSCPIHRSNIKLSRHNSVVECLVANEDVEGSRPSVCSIFIWVIGVKATYCTPFVTVRRVQLPNDPQFILWASYHKIVNDRLEGLVFILDSPP